MNRLSLVIFTAIFTLAALTPIQADARMFVGIGVGGCCYGGYGYPYYYPPYYPPPVVYAAPPAYYAPAPVAVTYAVPPSVQANQTSPTFVDSLGRTCRQFQATSFGPATGTACQMSDGTWRVMQ